MIGGAGLTRRHVALAIASCLCFLAAARGSELSVVQPNGLAAVWAANGVLLGLLLSFGRDVRQAVAVCLGGFCSSIISSRMAGHPIGLGVIFACANVMEAMIALLILRRLGATPGLTTRVSDVFAFLIACVIAPVVSGLIGALGLLLIAGVPLSSGFGGWYLSAVLGLALVAPGIVTTIELADAARRSPLCTRQVTEVILVLGLVALATIYVFYGARHSSLFMLMPCILLATFRLRQFGSVATVGIIALIAATATADGFGPIAAAEIVSRSGQVIYLQIFLATLFVSSMPVAAALAERDARADEAYLIADHFKAVVENAGDVIFRTDRAGRWTYLNPAWELLSGYPVRQSLGRSWDDCIDQAEHREIAEWAAPVFAGEVGTTRRLLRLNTASGVARWMELSIQALVDKEGAVAGTTGTLRDIHDRKRLEEQVMTAKRRAEERERAATLLAATDELTGLQNRRAFLAMLDRQIDMANETGIALAVAIFDVDHFKSVNDSHGHAVGDQVLQRVAARAVAIVRSGDLVGRIGGEEFGVLMPGATPEDAAAVAERLRAGLEVNEPDGEDVLPGVTVSIGLAAHAVGQTGAGLLADADVALYAAKGAGRNRIKIAA